MKRGNHWPEYVAARRQAEARYDLAELFAAYPDTLALKLREEQGTLYCTDEQAAALFRFLEAMPPPRLRRWRKGKDR